MEILVTRKSVYGNELVYPACDRARTFASMVGKKTLTAGDLKHIVALGYTVRTVTGGL